MAFEMDSCVHVRHYFNRAFIHVHIHVHVCACAKCTPLKTFHMFNFFLPMQLLKIF